MDSRAPSVCHAVRYLPRSCSPGALAARSAVQVTPRFPPAVTAGRWPRGTLRAASDPGGALTTVETPTPAADLDARPVLEGEDAPRVAVVIPCFRVTRAIEGVIAAIGPWAWRIYCVDDACPDGSGDHIEAHCADDPRVVVVRREANGGVGAATMTGYARAIEEGADVLVKIDGDGQMDPRLGPAMIRPILEHRADYTKGNRFFSPETVAGMPPLRLVGNAGLSFLTKLSTGYWDLFDPTNGFTALHAKVAAELPFDRIHTRYFFESDLLFRLGTLRARVVELPTRALYADEESHLSELDALLTFPGLHLRNLLKRIAYDHFLRGFGVASLDLLAGLPLITFGLGFGGFTWVRSWWTGDPATAGTVMLAALPVLLGLQLLLNFLSLDIARVPREPLHVRLGDVQVLIPQLPEAPDRDEA